MLTSWQGEGERREKIGEGRMGRRGRGRGGGKEREGGKEGGREEKGTEGRKGRGREGRAEPMHHPMILSLGTPRPRG